MPPKTFFPSFRDAPPVTIIAMLLFLIGLGVPASLAQMHSVRASSGRVRVAPTSGFSRPPFPRQGFRPTAIRSFGHRAFVRRFPFRHHGGFRFLLNACLNGPFIDPLFCQRLFFNNPFLFGQSILLPYPIYTESSYAPPEESPSIEQDQQSELNGKIDRLTNEVERLREQQAATPLQPSRGRQATSDKLPSRILVFRNGQREEIQNYALVGDTLWILTELRARKIPVSDLDMEATKNANVERGLDFP